MSRCTCFAAFVLTVSLPLVSAQGNTVAFSDSLARSSFDASTYGWDVQSYAKGQGTFGRTPGAVDSNTAFRWAVDIDASGDVTETNTVTKDTFATPTSSQYLEFSVTSDLNWSSANTQGLVFGISAYGTNSSGDEYATNFEFVTNEINSGITKTSYDNLLLSSYNDYGAPSGGEWDEYVESGINATSGFHTYTMQLFSNKVDFYVDGNEIAQDLVDVPTGVNLAFELNAWAPDSSWSSAYAPLAPNGYWYMDSKNVVVQYGTVANGQSIPEPASLLLGTPALAMLLRRRRS